MYLSLIEISNFRCLQALKLFCHKGVNVLIGENNTGKTAVLDALRLCLSLGAERRDLYLLPEDFCVSSEGHKSDTIEVHLTFKDPSDREQGIFVEMLSLTPAGAPVIKFHARYTYDGDRIRRKCWGGENEGQDVPNELLELFSVTHLGALRDATKDLTPHRGNRLSQLFLKIVDKPDRDTYATSANNQLKALPEWQDLLNRGKEKISRHLQKVSLEPDEVQLRIEFVESTFQRIVENLKLLLPIPSSQQSLNDMEQLSSLAFEVCQNGLGFNNLVYISTVLGDLLERRTKDPDSYIGLLIEEPEAHLHPQWQNLLFTYLQEIESSGIQVFITSHSPTITAKTHLDSLVLMSRAGGAVTSTPVRTFEISVQDKKHVQRFLDVTKSQLFFSRSVILVEGLSEVLLLPKLASLCSRNMTKSGTEIVNIDGVGFAPFANLFNSSQEQKRINTRCALITDGDPKEDGAISDRAAKAQNLSGGMLRVFVAPVTFEHELYVVNPEIMRSVYQSRHPCTNLSFSEDPANQAKEFVKKVSANKDKAALAQDLVAYLETTGTPSFIVPPYLARAFEWVFDGKDPD